MKCKNHDNIQNMVLEPLMHAEARARLYAIILSAFSVSIYASVIMAGYALLLPSSPNGITTTKLHLIRISVLSASTILPMTTMRLIRFTKPLPFCQKVCAQMSPIFIIILCILSYTSMVMDLLFFGAVRYRVTFTITMATTVVLCMIYFAIKQSFNIDITRRLMRMQCHTLNIITENANNGRACRMHLTEFKEIVDLMYTRVGYKLPKTVGENEGIALIKER